MVWRASRSPPHEPHGSGGPTTQVRVKTWGKSPRATAGRPAARQALPGASSNRGVVEGGPPEAPYPLISSEVRVKGVGTRVRVLERRGNASPRGMILTGERVTAPRNRTRLTVHFAGSDAVLARQPVRRTPGKKLRPRPGRSGRRPLEGGAASRCVVPVRLGCRRSCLHPPSALPEISANADDARLPLERIALPLRLWNPIRGDGLEAVPSEERLDARRGRTGEDVL
jgi:hypothetical protein